MRPDKIYFRVDYGKRIGRGHLSRCLALAEDFQAQGIEPIFVMRRRPSNLQDQYPFKTHWLLEAPDATTDQTEGWRVGSESSEAMEFLDLLKAPAFVVLDHYGLNLTWQSEVRSKGHKILLFQDSYTQEFEADVLINYNLNAKDFYDEAYFQSRKTTHFLIGTEFTPIKKEYALEHRLRFNSRTQIETVGVYLGGVSPEGFERVARILSESEYIRSKNLQWIVSNVDEKNILDQIFSKDDLQVHLQIPDLIPIYQKSQFFIGACGVSFLERACMGIYQISFLIAENQKEISKFIEQTHVGKVLGDLRSMNQNEIKLSLEKELEVSVAEKVKRVENSFALVDGRGSSRIVSNVLEVLK
jgi:UDP-2,4-diacetamido-2,4,6-trideoxy-beta-L-altropyranose hydrolase